VGSNGGSQQGVDLSTAGIHGYDEDFCAEAGLLSDGGGINYAYLSGISIAMGNAVTSGIATSSYQPWFTGDDIDVGGTGMGKNSSGNLTMGSPGNGASVSW
jgi:hypothetical protein